jgi:hypothetical protein
MDMGTVSILAFGLVVVGLEVLVMIKRKRGWGPQSSQIVGLTLVVIAALVLVTSQQVQQEKASAAFGLLGTIAGYLLGRSDRNKEPEQD